MLTAPPPPRSLYSPLQVIDVHTGPPRPGLGGILCTLDESSTLMSSSDSGLTAVLCLACLVLTSMPKQYTKTRCEISLCFRPNETHKQPYLSPVQRSTTKQPLFADCFRLLLLTSDLTVADTCLLKIYLCFLLFFFSFYSLLTLC